MIESVFPSARTVAAPYVFNELSTDLVPWRERYDFWRDHVRTNFNWDLHRGRDQYGTFQARFRHCVGEASSFVDMSCGECAVSRSPEAGDELRLILMSAGQARLERRGHGGTDAVSAGSLYLLDPGAVARATWSAHHDLCLKLPRRAVSEVLGVDPFRHGAPVCMLPNSGVAPFLTSQMRMLASHGAGMTADDCADVLENTTRLALMLLRRHLKPAAGESVDAQDGLLAAAKRYIELNHRRHDLTPDVLADVIGCSRRQLYRIFAREDITIAGYLREVRLQRCRADLETGSRERRVGAVAYAHGFADLPAFSKLFKRRFGVSPSDVQPTTGASAA